MLLVKRLFVHIEGWEYCVEATIGGYGPVERRYHLCRRRRWVRSRRLVENIKQKKEKVINLLAVLVL